MTEQSGKGTQAQRAPDKARRVTLKHVAQAVGVNVSTVSRALDPSATHGVSPELAEEIRKASRKLGYKPNAAAYTLKTNRTRTIGVVVPDLSDPVFPPIIRGIEDGLGLHDYVSIVANTDNDARREERVLETLNARGVDAFILATMKRHDTQIARRTEGKPVVTIVRKVDDEDISSVVHDEDEGVRRLLTHLVSLGHKDIAHIAGPQDVSTGFMRYSAYERYRKLLNVSRGGALTVSARTFSEEEGERCAEELLAAGHSFTAVVCGNDKLAIGALAAFQRRGLRCPDDISVTGFNDIPLVDRLQPPLTTVRVQHHKLGFEAALMAVEALKLPEKARKASHLVLPIELVVRASTRAARQELPEKIPVRRREAKKSA
jgi:LacI family transcriptional regulator